MSPLAGNVARSRPSTALPNAIDPSGMVKTWRQNAIAGPERLHGGEVRAQARLDGVVRRLRCRIAAAAPACVLERRMTTFDAASGIARLTTASARIAFILIMFWVMRRKSAIDAPARRCENPAWNGPLEGSVAIWVRCE